MRRFSLDSSHFRLSISRFEGFDCSPLLRSFSALFWPRSSLSRLLTAVSAWEAQCLRLRSHYALSGSQGGGCFIGRQSANPVAVIYLRLTITAVSAACTVDSS
jgi:hypothetical protein